MTQDLVRRSRGFRAVATIAIVTIAGLALYLHFVLPFSEIAAEAQGGRSESYRGGFVIGQYVASAVEAAPAILYLLALWETRRIFAGLARGELFEEAVIRGVGGVGRYLILGSGAVIALAVLLPNSGAVTRFEHVNTLVPTVVVLLVGAALNIVSRLLRRAAAMQAELEQII